MEDKRETGTDAGLKIPVQGCADNACLLQSYTLGLAEGHYERLYVRAQAGELWNQ